LDPDAYLLGPNLSTFLLTLSAFRYGITTPTPRTGLLSFYRNAGPGRGVGIYHDARAAAAANRPKRNSGADPVGNNCCLSGQLTGASPADGFGINGRLHPLSYERPNWGEAVSLSENFRALAWH
jgi:hypothetical protein